LKQATSTNCIFKITDFTDVKQKVLNWLTRFDTFAFLDNHHYSIPPHSLECLAAAGVKESFEYSEGNSLDQLDHFLAAGGWLFGHLGYDLKNEIEDLRSSHPDPIGFPPIYLFRPRIVIEMKADQVVISAEDPKKIWDEIRDSVPAKRISFPEIKISGRINREEYISIIKTLKQHILRGDCYEINFCQEFFAEKTHIDPFMVCKKMADISPSPFSALYRLGDKWLISESPERYLKKQGRKILSQPIKGTSRRIQNDQALDQDQREKLLYSAKERSENVMVVDLVRNDLSRICEEGTVKVDELFGIYSFPQVHQMISTVSGNLREDITFSQIIRATFPMGSMTGAPKKRVMDLIEKYEKTKRGIFSGAFGYIDPSGDFDFNVVIRSIFYNSRSAYVSFLAGSAITFYSDAGEEWEECMLKAKAMLSALQSTPLA
jgi:para-aminobenzoate synthetase component I